nr:hypothetical protein [Abalone asfa-like virus]
MDQFCDETQSFDFPSFLPNVKSTGFNHKFYFSDWASMIQQKHFSSFREAYTQLHEEMPQVVVKIKTDSTEFYLGNMPGEVYLVEWSQIVLCINENRYSLKKILAPYIEHMFIPCYEKIIESANHQFEDTFNIYKSPVEVECVDTQTDIQPVIDLIEKFLANKNQYSAEKIYNFIKNILLDNKSSQCLFLYSDFTHGIGVHLLMDLINKMLYPEKMTDIPSRILITNQLRNKYRVLRIQHPLKIGSGNWKTLKSLIYPGYSVKKDYGIEYLSSMPAHLLITSKWGTTMRWESDERANCIPISADPPPDLWSKLNDIIANPAVRSQFALFVTTRKPKMIFTDEPKSSMQTLQCFKYQY